MSKMNTLVK